jgi:outer membrane immunogenic protein
MLRTALRAAALAAAVLVPASAFAGPNFDWAGPYIGVQGGFASPNFTATGTISAVGSGYSSSSKNKTWSASASDKYGGGQFGDYGVFGGWRFQTPSGIVLGAETDFNWTDGLTATSNPLLSLGIISCQLLCVNLASVTTDVNWYGTLRGTIGQAIGQLYLYGTGGFAYGDVASSVSSNVTVFGFPILSASANDSGMRYGWTAGAGAAIAINERVSVKLDYLHVDLGSKDIFTWSHVYDPSGPGSTTIMKKVTDSVAFDTIKVGVSVRFP